MNKKLAYFLKILTYSFKYLTITHISNIGEFSKIAMCSPKL